MKATCRCGDSWSGLRIEHCTSCHATFSGTTAGDKHRTGDHAVSSGPNRRRCLTRAEMLEKGLEPRPNAHGTEIWGSDRGWSASELLSPHDADSLGRQVWGNPPPSQEEAV